MSLVTIWMCALSGRNLILWLLIQGVLVQGWGFYHIDIRENAPTQWLNLQNCGVVRIKEGEISVTELEKELSDIFCKGWPQHIRELDRNMFLVRFPPCRKVANIKNYPSFDLRKPRVKVKVLEWVGNLYQPFLRTVGSLGTYQGMPPMWCSWKVFAQMAPSFGITMDMNQVSLLKSFYEVVGVKIACRNPTKIPREGFHEIGKKTLPSLIQCGRL